MHSKVVKHHLKIHLPGSRMSPSGGTSIHRLPFQRSYVIKGD